MNFLKRCVFGHWKNFGRFFVFLGITTVVYFLFEMMLETKNILFGALFGTSFETLAKVDTNDFETISFTLDHCNCER